MSGLAPKHCAAANPRHQRQSRTRKDEGRPTDGYPTPPAGDGFRADAPHSRSPAWPQTRRESADTPTKPGGTVRRTISILAAATMAVAGTLAIGAPASAATPSLRFHGAQYDSPGSNPRTNASLNNEWVSLINSGRKPVNLSRY